MLRDNVSAGFITKFTSSLLILDIRLFSSVNQPYNWNLKSDKMIMASLPWKKNHKCRWNVRPKYKWLIQTTYFKVLMTSLNIELSNWVEEMITSVPQNWGCVPSHYIDQRTVFSCTLMACMYMQMYRTIHVDCFKLRTIWFNFRA